MFLLCFFFECLLRTTKKNQQYNYLRIARSRRRFPFLFTSTSVLTDT